MFCTSDEKPMEILAAGECYWNMSQAVMTDVAGILGYNVKDASGLFDLSLQMIKSAHHCSDEEAMPK